MVLVLASCSGTTEQNSSISHTRLSRDDWAEDVKKGVNDFLDAYGIDSKNYKEDTYVVFDFDNTCSIFDVEEQLSIYQLQTMSFEIEPENLKEVLLTGLQDPNLDRSELGYGKGSYNDWVYDITNAYEYLYKTYGPFNAEGLDNGKMKIVQEDSMWKEFATKMRTLYDLVYDAESASVAYPWILYWFTGMTEEQVYNLSLNSHNVYKKVETSLVTWESPKDIKTKVGPVSYEWISGVQVSDNIKELWKVLDDNGIDVWVCSASGVNQIRAAVDAWDLHEYCTGLIAMTNSLDENNIYINSYDYETGCGYYAKENGQWEKMTRPEKAQTQGFGKVEAITNAISPEYNNHGPIGGFMDSTGDYNFCTEFETLKLVICFNRASRKITDGGGVIAEVAVYEKDTLGYDFAKADEAGDTYYLLQGRNENGLRTFNPSNLTNRYGKEGDLLFANEDNQTQLQYMIDHKMTVAEAINEFAIKRSVDDKDNVLGIKYGFLKEFGGYHQHK